jgi:hypothetical protein
MAEPSSCDRPVAIERSGGFGHDYENDSVTALETPKDFAESREVVAPATGIRSNARAAAR